MRRKVLEGHVRDLDVPLDRLLALSEHEGLAPAIVGRAAKVVRTLGHTAPGLDPSQAVTRVLDTNRGDWGGGILFGGSYEVTYGPVKHGGKNLLQTAKITFALEASL